MQPDDETRLRHMIEAAEAVREFVAGKERSDLDRDRMLTFALTHAITIIGEAASKTSTDARSNFAALPWPNIISMRNRLVHAYYEIDRTILWRTATEEVPALLAVLQATGHEPD